MARRLDPHRPSSAALCRRPSLPALSPPPRRRAAPVGAHGALPLRLPRSRFHWTPAADPLKTLLRQSVYRATGRPARARAGGHRRGGGAGYRKFPDNHGTYDYSGRARWTAPTATTFRVGRLADDGRTARRTQSPIETVNPTGDGVAVSPQRRRLSGGVASVFWGRAPTRRLGGVRIGAFLHCRPTVGALGPAGRSP